MYDDLLQVWWSTHSSDSCSINHNDRHMSYISIGWRKDTGHRHTRARRVRRRSHLFLWWYTVGLCGGDDHGYVSSLNMLCDQRLSDCSGDVLNRSLSGVLYRCSSCSMLGVSESLQMLARDRRRLTCACPGGTPSAALPCSTVAGRRRVCLLSALLQPTVSHHPRSYRCLDLHTAVVSDHYLQIHPITVTVSTTANNHMFMIRE